MMDMPIDSSRVTGFQNKWEEWSASPEEHLDDFIQNIQNLNNLETGTAKKMSGLKYKIFCQDDGTLTVGRVRKRDQAWGAAFGKGNPVTDLQNVYVLLSKSKKFAEAAHGKKLRDMVQQLEITSEKIQSLSTLYENKGDAKKAGYLKNINEDLTRKLVRIKADMEFLSENAIEAGTTLIEEGASIEDFVAHFRGSEDDIIGGLNTLPHGDDVLSIMDKETSHPISVWWNTKSEAKQKFILPYILYDYLKNRNDEDFLTALSLLKDEAAGKRTKMAGAMFKELFPTYWEQKSLLRNELAIATIETGIVEADPKSGALIVSTKGKERVRKRDVGKTVGIAGAAAAGTVGVALAAATAPVWAPAALATIAATGLGTLAIAAAGYAASKGIEATVDTVKLTRQTLEESGASKEQLQMFDAGTKYVGGGVAKLLDGVAGDAAVEAIAAKTGLDKKLVKDILSKAKTTFEGEKPKKGAKPKIELTEEEYAVFQQIMKVLAKQEAPSETETIGRTEPIIEEVESSEEAEGPSTTTGPIIEEVESSEESDPEGLT